MSSHCTSLSEGVIYRASYIEVSMKGGPISPLTRATFSLKGCGSSLESPTNRSTGREIDNHLSTGTTRFLPSTRNVVEFHPLWPLSETASPLRGMGLVTNLSTDRVEWTRSSASWHGPSSFPSRHLPGLRAFFGSLHTTLRPDSDGLTNNPSK